MPSTAPTARRVPFHVATEDLRQLEASRRTSLILTDASDVRCILDIAVRLQREYGAAFLLRLKPPAEAVSVRATKGLHLIGRVDPRKLAAHYRQHGDDAPAAARRATLTLRRMDRDIPPGEHWRSARIVAYGRSPAELVHFEALTRPAPAGQWAELAAQCTTLAGELAARCRDALL